MADKNEVENRLLKLIQDEYGADKHPILVMAEICFDEECDTKLRLDASKSIMPFIEATKKAIEVKGEVNANVGVLRILTIDKEDVDD